MINAAAIRIRYDAVSPNLDEKGVRFFAASEALAAGRGGIPPDKKVFTRPNSDLQKRSSR
ncbi:MAG: hypothetical protein V1721_05280 [Pseudomonadota bacterium]